MIRAHVVLAVAALAAATGCTSSNPSQPSGTTAAVTANATASIAAPRPVSPANNAQIRNTEQPVTIAWLNAIHTAPGGVTYGFEVASDATFATKVQTKDGVVEGSGGQTSARLDTLAPAKDYWWHARAVGGGTTGVFGPAYKLSIGPAITISTPVPISPLTGAQTGTRPPLRVTNVTRTGPAGAITYKFEIAATPAFNPILQTGTNAEGINETGYVPTVDLATNTGYFWRATAQDLANGISSQSSAVQSFVTSDPLWTGAIPPGTSGHAIMGAGWERRTVTAYPGLTIQTTFESPRIEISRFFDLLDRGFSPNSALDWMNSNGYHSDGVWYPDVQVAGFAYEYVAFVHGTWELVIRVGG